ncbi:MAG: PspC domain-containing protein [Bacteroidetes bacterium]|nr:MAG: PspC domain-containing protein [Bacteroidota bacterium]
MEPKRLYRSTTSRVIGGVAAGLAGYFKLDPLLVRLLFVIFTFFGGGAVIIYIILWIVTPDEPGEGTQTQKSTPMESQEKPNKPSQESRQKGNLIGGLVLITLGAIFLADQFIPSIDFGDLWPVILIVIGIALLFNAYGRKPKKND